MTVEEYLKGVREIYFQVSARAKGKQILVASKTQRLTDVRDSKGMLSTIRFCTVGAHTTLSLPAIAEMDEMYSDRAAITFDGMRLVIWPTREETNAQGSA